jgi:hypothetical protein
MVKCLHSCAVAALLLLVTTILALAQAIPPEQPTTTTIDRSRPARAQAPRPGDEGELIELEEVQIHGEIALPNVTITVSRQEPQFKRITLERTPAEGLNDLDLSGLRDGLPPAPRINDWKIIINRPRQ